MGYATRYRCAAMPSVSSKSRVAENVDHATATVKFVPLRAGWALAQRDRLEDRLLDLDTTQTGEEEQGGRS